MAAIYGSSHTSNTPASAKAQAASILAGVTAGLLATTARRELGGLTPILMIEAGDGEQQARVRAGFEFDSLVPELLRDVVTSDGLTVLAALHDLNLAASFCDRVLIMYAGQVVEVCAARALHEARHPYTRGLLAALPRIDSDHAPLPVLRRDPAWLDAVGER